MKVIEATFSFLIFCSLFPLFFYGENLDLKNEYYSLKISQDILRVLYLKGNFEDFDKNKLNEDLLKIKELTGLCIAFEQEDVASCIPNKANVVVKRGVFINGKLKIITITFGV